MARHVIEINKEQFEKLCGYMCTQAEIADFFNVSVDTISRWCKRTYGEGFADTYKKHIGSAKCTLRRYQMQLAETNPTMAIFLGKQYLGQKDVNTMDGNITVENPFSGLSEKELKKLANDTTTATDSG